MGMQVYGGGVDWGRILVTLWLHTISITPSLPTSNVDQVAMR